MESIVLPLCFISMCLDWGHGIHFGGPCFEDFQGKRVLGSEFWLTLWRACYRRRVLILLHGYRSTTDGARETYRIITKNLSDRGMLGPDGQYDLVIGVFMPLGRLRISFATAEGRAVRAGRELAAMLRACGASSVDVIAHSLGCRVAMESILNSLADAGGFTARNVFLLNAAIDDEECEKKYYEAISSRVSGKLAVIFSQKDEVLVAYRVAGSVPRNMWAFIKRVFGAGGHDDGGFGDRALGFSGPENPEACPANVVPIDATDWCPDHSAARNRPEFYAEMEKILKAA